jgi:hypothetical protein
MVYHCDHGLRVISAYFNSEYRVMQIDVDFEVPRDTVMLERSEASGGGKLGADHKKFKRFAVTSDFLCSPFV